MVIRVVASEADDTVRSLDGTIGMQIAPKRLPPWGSVARRDAQRPDEHGLCGTRHCLASREANFGCKQLMIAIIRRIWSQRLENLVWQSSPSPRAGSVRDLPRRSGILRDRLHEGRLETIARNALRH